MQTFKPMRIIKAKPRRAMRDSRGKRGTPAKGFLVIGVVVGAMIGLFLSGVELRRLNHASYESYLIAKETVPFEFVLKGAAMGLICGLIMDARANGALSKKQAWLGIAATFITASVVFSIF